MLSSVLSAKTDRQSRVKDKDDGGGEAGTHFSGQGSTVRRKGILAAATACKALRLECGRCARPGRITRPQQSDKVTCRLPDLRGNRGR